ncbi:hypothetical protein LBMAG52_06750 [Planctomycetia bacterium]|nr:hypothetical protein LBMAG52_06750 [Planctomycetia bacterium]
MSADRSVSRRAWMSSVATASLVGVAAAQDKAPAKPNREELEKAFSERMTGTVLVGNYSVVGKDLKPANPERYELKKVSKLADDLWVFEARIKYGQTDVTLPLTLRMIWAEDTPMISLTNANLPGLGAAFGARVIFHGDLYAGTWQHGKVGGHLWGTIQKAEAAKEEKSK